MGRNPQARAELWLTSVGSKFPSRLAKSDDLTICAHEHPVASSGHIARQRIALDGHPLPFPTSVSRGLCPSPEPGDDRTPPQSDPIPL